MMSHRSNSRKNPCRKHVWSRLQLERSPHRDEKSINSLIWNHVWYERSLSTELTLKCLDHSLISCLGHSGSFNQPQTQLLNETQYQVTVYREQASCSTQAARTSEPKHLTQRHSCWVLHETQWTQTKETLRQKLKLLSLPMCSLTILVITNTDGNHISRYV